MDTKKLYKMGGAIIGIILFLLLCVILLSSCSSKGNYSKLEKKLLEATEEYVSDGKVVVNEGTSTVVSSDELVSADYIKPLNKIKDDNCTATITVMNNGGAYNYIPNITCNNYKTVTLKEKIVEDNLTTSESGLYYENGEYIFKGKNPNNYLKFDGSIWLIIKIDNNGNLKVVSVEASKQTVAWDNKFNENTNKTSGENDYATSNIHDILEKTYAKYKSSNKKHLIPFSACIGKRAVDSIDKTSLIDCSEKLNNQYLGLISPSDYALASYDPDCKDVISGSCINFNYLYMKLSETWTSNAIADNSYEAILYSPGRIRKAETREGHTYNTVIYLSGSEKYIDGDGSEENPYIIK